MILTSFYEGQTIIVSGWAKNPLARIIAEIRNQQFNHKVCSIKLVIELADDSTRFEAMPEDWCEV
jgi:hypothetical protein